MDNIPAKLRDALMPFQAEGVRAALKFGGRCLIGDEMGLGKTLQGLSVACAYRDHWPLLIVVPSSMRWPWVDELEKWLDGTLRPSDINVVSDGKNTAVGEKLVTVVTYDLLRNKAILEQVQKRDFQVVICDESHYLKGHDSQRTQAAVPLLKGAKRAVLLSGTPALARPIDLFSQLDALRPGKLGTRWDFAKRFCDLQKRFWGRRVQWDFNGASNLAELNALLVERYMIRRRKEDVLTELPPKRRQCVRIDAGGAAGGGAGRRAGEEKLSGLQRMLRDLGGGEGPGGGRQQVLSTLFELWKTTGAAKVASPAFKEYLADMVESGHKFLVFAHHLDVLDSIEATLKALRPKPAAYVRIDGSTPSKERHVFIKRFQERPVDECQVAVLSMTACGQGITLTAAADIVFAELHWTPAVLQQAEDRVHRIGQAHSVNIRYCLAAHSVDDVLWPMINRKLGVVGQALDGKAAAMDTDGAEGGPAEGGEDDLLDGLIGGRGATGGGGAGPPSQSSQPSQPGTGSQSQSQGGCVSALERMDALSGRASLGEDYMDPQDIRGFFGGRGRGAARQKPPETIVIDDEGEDGVAAGGAEAGGGWVCAVCTLENTRGAGTCAACETPRPPAPKAPAPPPPASAPPPTATAVGGATAAGGEGPAGAGQPKLLFELSKHTGRVFVFDGQQAYTGASFLPDELRTMDLPPALEAPASLRQAAAFVRELQDLTALQRKSLHGKLVRPPLARHLVASAAAQRAVAAGPCFERIPTMKAFVNMAPPPAEAGAPAAGAGGGGGAGGGQGEGGEAVARWVAEHGPVACGEGGRPCCLICRGGLSWSQFERQGYPLCSEDCIIEWRVMTQPGAARKYLWALERGVCRICGLDAHALFEQVRALPLEVERYRRIKKSFKALGDKRAAGMAKAPKEGDFWQADHIVAVELGGGGSDLSNLQTLCSECHDAKTRVDHKKKRLAPGSSADIRAFFGKRPKAASS